MKTKEHEPALFGEQEVKPAPAAKLPKVAKSTAVAKVEPDAGVDDLIILAQAAANPQVDPAKMQALREIMKDIRQERREEAFTLDFAAMQDELPEIDKDGKIIIDPKETARNQKKQVTPYSTFPNIHRICKPIWLKHHFSMWHEVRPGPSVGIIVHSFLRHTKGFYTTSEFPLVLDTTGSKNNNQGAGSSLSYGKRYNTIGLLNIISFAPDDRDLDGNKEAPPPEAKINGSQAKQLLKAIDECGIEATRFMEKYKITAVHELPLAQFAEAIKACADYGQAVKDTKK